MSRDPDPRVSEITVLTPRFIANTLVVMHLRTALMKNIALLTLATVLGVTMWSSHADVGHNSGKAAGRDQQHESGKPHRRHGHSDEGAHHQHGEWIDPPDGYAEKVSAVWADADAIVRGEEIYEQQCVACHGVDGQGTGPIAQALSHPPADLTNNFHTSPGSGDAYLFWRVSEGGTVEPFKSQGSNMPAFKDVLSVSERWDVLAYIHTFFHQGLMEWKQSGAVGEESQSKERDS